MVGSTGGLSTTGEVIIRADYQSNGQAVAIGGGPNTAGTASFLSYNAPGMAGGSTSAALAITASRSGATFWSTTATTPRPPPPGCSPPRRTWKLGFTTRSTAGGLNATYETLPAIGLASSQWNLGLSSTAGQIFGGSSNNSIQYASLTLNSGGGLTAISNAGILNIDGTILAFSGNAGISGGQLQAATRFTFFTEGNLNLASMSVFNNDPVKAGPGTMTISAPQFWFYYNGYASNALSVDAGTLQLNYSPSGSLAALMPNYNYTTSTAPGQAVALGLTALPVFPRRRPPTSTR